MKPLVFSRTALAGRPGPPEGNGRRRVWSRRVGSELHYHAYVFPSGLVEHVACHGVVRVLRRCRLLNADPCRAWTRRCRCQKAHHLIGAIKLHRILVPCAHFEQMSSHLVYVRCLRRCRLHDGVLVVFHRTICPCVVGLWLLVFVRARWGILHGEKLG